MSHLLVALSSHGYGHWAQTAPVLNALRSRLPRLRLTLSTTLPRDVLARRLAGDFAHIPINSDVGMIMHDALNVDVVASAHAYAQFHAEWERAVDAETQRLQTLRPDLVLADIPYLTLAAAARADIPTVSLGSLNWADIYQHYCATRPEAAGILDQMRSAYATTGAFLQPAPSMPMAWLEQRRPIAPIARLGHHLRPALNSRCGVGDEQILVLVALGGIPTRLDPASWPQHAQIRWIVPADWNAVRTDMIAFESLDLHFMDVLCSVDVLLTKPGYGSFAEAACNQTPVLYLPRDDWPETPHLVSWLKQHGQCRSIALRALHGDSVIHAVQELVAMQPQPAPAAQGARQAADYLLARLGADDN